MTASQPGTAVGIDVGGTKTAVGLVELDSGTVRDIRAIDSHAERGSDELHRRLRAVLEELVAGSEVRPAGVGVVVPELVSPVGEVLTDVVIPGLSGDLASAWADLGVTAVEADVRGAAFAEGRFGQGVGLGSFVFVSVGTGISCCFVLDGRPWTGANGAAILLGSGVLVEGSSFGSDARELSLEAFAGGPALVQRYRDAGGAATSARDVLERCALDPVAREVATAAGSALGRGLAELVNLLDPEAVVVGGGLGSAAGPYRDAAVEAARSAIWADAARAVPIVSSAMGPQAGVVGAALFSRSGI
jgi:glucokinase